MLYLRIKLIKKRCNAILWTMMNIKVKTFPLKYSLYKLEESVKQIYCLVCLLTLYPSLIPSWPCTLPYYLADLIPYLITQLTLYPSLFTSWPCTLVCYQADLIPYLITQLTLYPTLLPSWPCTLVCWPWTLPYYPGTLVCWP